MPLGGVALFGGMGLRLHVRAETPCTGDDCPSDGQPLLFETSQSYVYRILGIECLGESPSVASGFGYPCADVRSCDVRRVTQDDGALPEHHARGLQRLDGVDEGLLRLFHNLGELWTEQSACVLPKLLDHLRSDLVGRDRE